MPVVSVTWTGSKRVKNFRDAPLVLFRLNITEAKIGFDEFFMGVQFRI
jgi:hypothetical protein